MSGELPSSNPTKLLQQLVSAYESDDHKQSRTRFHRAVMANGWKCAYLGWKEELAWWSDHLRTNPLIVTHDPWLVELFVLGVIAGEDAARNRDDTIDDALAEQLAHAATLGEEATAPVVAEILRSTWRAVHHRDGNAPSRWRLQLGRMGNQLKPYLPCVWNLSSALEIASTATGDGRITNAGIDLVRRHHEIVRTLWEQRVVPRSALVHITTINLNEALEDLVDAGIVLVTHAPRSPDRTRLYALTSLGVRCARAGSVIT